MRLIDADELFKDFEKAAWFNNADRDDVAEELLLNAPTIDAEPVRHGHWIEANDGTHYCSNCGHDAPFTWDDIDRNFMHSADEVPDFTANYCYCCGAKMDEVNE